MRPRFSLSSAVAQMLLPRRESPRRPAGTCERKDMAQNAGIDLVLVDFDDTLVATAPHYERARNELFRLMLEAGFEQAAARELHHDIIDPEMRRQYGFGPQRLAHAFRETYARLCAREGRQPDTALLERCASLGRAVVGTPPAIDGALEALRRLAERLPTVLYTQSGNARYQLECVRGAGVLDLLPEEKVHVCPHKTAEAFAQALAHFGVTDPGRAWMVGNSIRSDINPALEIGAHAILIEVENPWAYDVVEPIGNGFARAPSFAAAVDLLLQVAVGR
jgi:putative hydrolase of the HAD superfamily